MIRLTADSAAFDALYTENSGEASDNTPQVATLMIWPSPRSSIPGASPRISRSGA
ncbi:Uncharacterised protein [Mycobacterium tuberculosis]|uniref:Uncharacterized protein n=1 Tax=Mycobacterium tuberculosis TaxID=1773 RepID=A0A655IIC3_MYCTX|nr:Uncharacterised protein [Mycobacterium tuberculosis]CFS57026.1 Uncharacterised protein [Mycobacterium tuberculosis]CKR10565.1 Uncharacterised protein [Mycobacterium tuberculosis]CKU26380.1 Uncharacterised protein [Mycobacterium tuberculosis]CNM48878.1 Uncharacterised protein [Mycobacterium tuberculosis]